MVPGPDNPMYKIGAFEGLGESSIKARGIGVFGEPVLHVVHAFGAAFVDGARTVEANDVPAPGGHNHFGAGDTGSTDAGHDNLQVLDLFLDQLDCIYQSGEDDDGGSVLVVVEDRDV